MPSEPKRKSWSNLPIRWALRSMWKSFPCHSAWATPWVNVQARHRLVGELRVEADHVGPLELADEGQRVADGRQEDVAPRLVRLGLERDPHAVAPLADVLAAQVDRLLVAVEREPDVLGRVGLDALAAAPHHEDLGAQLGAEVDGVERLAHREPADVGIVGGERALLEHRPARTGWSSPSAPSCRSRRARRGTASGSPRARPATTRSGTRSSSWKFTP